MNSFPLIFASALVVFLMALLIVLSGAEVGFRTSRAKTTRTEYEAMITAPLASLACYVIVRSLGETAELDLGQHFDLLMVGFSLGLFTLGILLGFWLRNRAHKPHV